jgi:hypothetical protein
MPPEKVAQVDWDHVETSSQQAANFLSTNNAGNIITKLP